ncbi:trehalose-6-phosphate synthase [Pseudoroseomonas globiformis]|uniref:Trehalose-6-phosphate synthase n=1 Tax=Teichococcus globiformis TaxID=2307229 RepID=A0ABV7FZN7_9PROT
MSRLVVVSNRVAPIHEGEATAGGLAAGVMDALRQSGGLWFGWSGRTLPQSVVPPDSLTPGSPPAVACSGPVTLYTTDLTQRDYDEYYKGFSNSTLWPTMHYQISLARFEHQDYLGYQRVNRHFAVSLAALLKEDDVIWVHDYHLMLLATALREIGVRNRIGFFLHVPFPASSVFSTIPVHAELGRGLATFDLIGFQTEGDQRAFSNYMREELQAETCPEGHLQLGHRVVRTGVYPIGVEADPLRAEAIRGRDDPAICDYKGRLDQRALIMSVERLDYSKGLRQRFSAFERFLVQCPEWRRQVEYLQIAPPSRSDVEAYQTIRRELEGEAGRINGRFAELDWTPLRYLNRSFPRDQLMPLYALAAVGLVTPLRDGMNLVAKEYVAAQDPEDPGVLILSQFAGAARELDGAVRVNPHDEAGMAYAMKIALQMPVAEKRDRHASMMRSLRTNSLDAWRDRFLFDLRLAEAGLSAAA